MWSNPLVGSITTLALLMLLWPLISKGWSLVRKPKRDAGSGLTAEQPID